MAILQSCENLQVRRFVGIHSSFQDATCNLQFIVEPRPLTLTSDVTAKQQWVKHSKWVRNVQQHTLFLPFSSDILDAKTGKINYFVTKDSRRGKERRGVEAEMWTEIGVYKKEEQHTKLSRNKVNKQECDVIHFLQNK